MQCYLLRQNMPVFNCYSLQTLRFFTFNWEKVKVQKVYSSKRPYAFLYHIASIDDIKILAISSSDFHLKVKESLLISRDEPILKMKHHYLFTYLIVPFHTKLYFNIYYCYSYCINITIAS